jgi:hypothetical protein
LGTIDDDVHPLAVADLLKEKRIHWIAQLQAERL